MYFLVSTLDEQDGRLIRMYCTQQTDNTAERATAVRPVLTRQVKRLTEK